MSFDFHSRDLVMRLCPFTNLLYTALCTKHIIEHKLELKLTSKLNRYTETWNVMIAHNKYIRCAFRLHSHL